LKTLNLEDVADVVVPSPARPTASANELGSGRDFRSHPDIPDAFPYGLDDAREFVALDDRVGCERVTSVPDVDVRTADPDGHDADKDVVGSGPGSGDIAELDFAW
jgi:hypothetical protein